jgi:hypothetical protein
MQQQLHAEMAPSARLYYGLRIFLHKRRWLLRFSQLLRGYLVFGPFRNIILRAYRKSRVNQPVEVDRSTMFPVAPNAATIVDRLNRLGCARLGELRDMSVEKILEYCDAHRRGKHWNPHRECAEVDLVARNSLIVDVARKYLECEPIVWLTQLKWTLPSPDHSGPDVTAHQEPIQYDSHSFHYDILDWRSLTLFIYLTDVDADSGPHVVVEGTNSRKSLSEIRGITIDDDSVERKYGSRIRTILGQKGTAFIEDTSSLHKVAAGHKNRLMLSIDYVIGRRPPPERPLLAG